MKARGITVVLGTFLCPQDSLGCRLVFLLMQYCVAANYYWLLVEGVYLYTLLAFSVFSEQRVFKLYLSIGWGKLLPVIPLNPSPHPEMSLVGWKTQLKLPHEGGQLVLRLHCWPLVGTLHPSHRMHNR